MNLQMQLLIRLIDIYPHAFNACYMNHIHSFDILEYANPTQIGVTVGNKSFVVSIVLFFIDFGPNGCNKTSITNYVNYIVDRLVRNLTIMSQQFKSQRQNGIKVQDVRLQFRTLYAF